MNEDTKQVEVSLRGQHAQIPGCHPQNHTRLGMVAHTCNPSIQRIEARRTEVVGYSRLHSEFKASLGLQGTEFQNRVRTMDHIGSRAPIQIPHPLEDLGSSLTPSLQALCFLVGTLGIGTKPPHTGPS